MSKINDSGGSLNVDGLANAQIVGNSGSGRQMSSQITDNAVNENILGTQQVQNTNNVPSAQQIQNSHLIQNNVHSTQSIIRTLTSWVLPELYNISQLSKPQVWQVSFDGESLVMQWGFIGGVIQTSKTKVELNNSGKSLHEQALQEANHRCLQMWRKGYRPYGFKPGNALMIHRPVEWKEQKNPYPLGIQIKMDGGRALAVLMETLKFVTRNLNNYFELKHLDDDMIRLISYLPVNSVPDGEAYTPLLTHQDLMSAIKTKNYVHPNMPLVDFYIFDCILNAHPNATYTERHHVVNQAYHNLCRDIHPRKPQIHVLTYWLAYSPQEISWITQLVTDQGHEGVVIIKLDGIYKNGKNAQKYKSKLFMDEEAMVIGLDAATGTQEGACIFIMQLADGTRFRSNPTGSLDQRKIWFANPGMVIGHKYTVRYNKKSNDGVPVHPRVIVERDDDN